MDRLAPPATVLKHLGCTGPGTLSVWGWEAARVSPSSRSPVFIIPGRGLCLCSPCSCPELGSEPRTKPQPLPTQKLDPAQHCSCYQSPSSQPDTCCPPPSSPSPPSGAVGRAGGYLHGLGCKASPSVGPLGASPNPVLLFSYEWRLHPARRAPPPRLLLPSNRPGQNHTNKEDWGSAQAPDGLFLLTLPKIFKTTLNWVVIMMPCYT